MEVETFGSWGPIGLNFIKDLGRKIWGKTGQKNATCHIIQEISMGIQRGNARFIMGTIGPQQKLEEYFDLLMPRAEKLTVSKRFIFFFRSIVKKKRMDCSHLKKTRKILIYVMFNKSN